MRGSVFPRCYQLRVGVQVLYSASPTLQKGLHTAGLGGRSSSWSGIIEFMGRMASSFLDNRWMSGFSVWPSLISEAGAPHYCRWWWKSKSLKWSPLTGWELITGWRGRESWPLAWHLECHPEAGLGHFIPVLLGWKSSSLLAWVEVWPVVFLWCFAGMELLFSESFCLCRLPLSESFCWDFFWSETISISWLAVSSAPSLG